MNYIKSQSSTEFLILTGLGFLIVMVFIALSANEVKEFRDQKEFFLLKDLALKLQKEASIAASVEDGYERTFTLPDKLENTVDYSIITQNSVITVNSSKTVFSVRIPDITGNFTKGSNKIERKAGKIYINRQ
ncbi:MAG: hypothetical protein QF436_00930 [Candidatus Woesearchaeota archaeon]|nr:hypothetical protein [Candidatus Woesearchaeota archaeon]MDP7622659.1 hypothetical protein [Candidatus Woesearchaeota archaeon]HJN57254.1 hypothetical protein [Candidatus Woesearchaeota archaeon]